MEGNTPRHYCGIVGRAIAQAVSRWLRTAATRVRAPVCSSGICGGQSGARAGCLHVLRFPLPIFIPPISPFSQLPGAGTIGQKWPTCRVDPVWTPPPHYAKSVPWYRLKGLGKTTTNFGQDRRHKSQSLNQLPVE
jgi:hypothetical protein